LWGRWELLERRRFLEKEARPLWMVKPIVEEELCKSREDEWLAPIVLLGV